MLIAFFAITALYNIWLGWIWSRETFLNSIMKLMFTGMGIWSTLLLCGALWPLISDGTTMRFM